MLARYARSCETKAKRNFRRRWCVDRRKISCVRPCRVHGFAQSSMVWASCWLTFFIHGKRMRNGLNEPGEIFIGTCGGKRIWQCVCLCTMYEVRGTIWEVRRLHRKCGACRRPVADRVYPCTRYDGRFIKFPRLRASLAKCAGCHDF